MAGEIPNLKRLRSSRSVTQVRKRPKMPLRWRSFAAFSTLIFFSLLFWRTARKTTKKARIFYPCRTPKILGKEGKNAQKNKEFLGKKKSKEIQKSKEKKIREGLGMIHAFIKARRSGLRTSLVQRRSLRASLRASCKDSMELARSRIMYACGWVAECTKIARFSAAAAAIFTAPPIIACFFEAPRCAISSAKKTVSEPRFLLRRKRLKMVLTAEFPAIPSSAIKISSERRCAILVHSGGWCLQVQP